MHNWDSTVSLELQKLSDYRLERSTGTGSFICTKRTWFYICHRGRHATSLQDHVLSPRPKLSGTWVFSGTSLHKIPSPDDLSFRQWAYPKDSKMAGVVWLFWRIVLLPLRNAGLKWSVPDGVLLWMGGWCREGPEGTKTCGTEYGWNAMPTRNCIARQPS